VGQEHLDSLSGVDASFLHQEGDATHMHIGGIALLDGPAPAFDEIREHVRSRLHLVPRYRQKLAAPPLGLGRWRWIDDPTFHLDYHLRHSALPAPGDEHKLHALVGRVFAQRLDRTKPLWELYIVEGLTDGRWAIVSKTHHALVDGVSGVDLMTMLFDIEPEPRDAGGDHWQPRPEPSAAELAAAGVTDGIKRVASLPFRALAAAAQPERTLEQAREVLGGVGEVVWAGLNPPAEAPLNVRVGPHRRYAVVPARLEEFKAVKDAFGGTVNDVVLAVVTGALRRWMHERGQRTEGVELRAGVPVSIRADDQRGTFGNQLAQVLCPLPVSEPDPIERLVACRTAMAGLKDSRQALGAEVIAGLEDFAPPTILAQASRMNFSRRFYNLLVTNVPGPQFPLYVLGRELQAVYPVPFLAGDRALAVAVLSYNGAMCFGLLADYDSLPDLDVIAEGLEASLAELLALANAGPLGRRKPKATRARQRAAKARAESSNGKPGRKRPAPR